MASTYGLRSELIFHLPPSTTITQQQAVRIVEDIKRLYDYVNQNTAIIDTLTDTDTIVFTVDSTTGEISADVVTQMSITSDANGIKLDGDAAAPGNDYFYGTDGAGAKGFFPTSGIATSPGGVDTNVQFNDAGAFGGDADFTYDKTNNILTTVRMVLEGNGVGALGTLYIKEGDVANQYIVMHEDPVRTGSAYVTFKGQGGNAAAMGVLFAAGAPDEYIFTDPGGVSLFTINIGTGLITVPDLAGVGTRMVTANASGDLATSALPTDYFTMILNHGNFSPNDLTPNYFGWRIALGAEPAKNNNPAMAPCDMTVIGAKMTWRSSTAGSAEVIDFYLSVWSNGAVPILQSDTIIIQTDLTNNAATGSNNWASSGALSIDVDDGELLWAHYVGPWATNPVNLTITLELLCQVR